MIRPRSLAQAICFATILSVSSSVSAGDDWITTVFINMTPDELSDAESRACVGIIKKRIKKDSFYDMKSLGETKARELVSQPKGGAHFADWPTSVFQRSIWDSKGPWSSERNNPNFRGTDLLVLVDCRPAQSRMDVVLVHLRDMQRSFISLRGVAYSAKFVGLLASRLGWQTFED